MAGNKIEDGKWSESKVENGDDGLRTLECLRGRLLAERQASRVAKEESEFMGKKLVELEKKLREETKLMKKAEKRLKLLMKKLESLNLLNPNLEVSEQSSSSQKSAISFQSSTAESGSKPQQNSVEIASEEATESAQNQDSSFNEENAGSNSCSESDTKDLSLPLEGSGEISSTNSEDPNRCSSLKSSIDVKDQIPNDHVDDSMALVLVSPPEKNPGSETKIVNKNVVEVLDTLKHIRERLQSQLETRRMMVVGPA